MSDKRLIKEGDQYWDPDTGCIYNLEGELVAHDCVLRNYNFPKINFSEYIIIDDSKHSKEEEREIVNESKTKEIE